MSKNNLKQKISKKEKRELKMWSIITIVFIIIIVIIIYVLYRASLNTDDKVLETINSNDNTTQNILDFPDPQKKINKQHNKKSVFIGNLDDDEIFIGENSYEDLSSISHYENYHISGKVRNEKRPEDTSGQPGVNSRSFSEDQKYVISSNGKLLIDGKTPLDVTISDKFNRVFKLSGFQDNSMNPFDILNFNEQKNLDLDIKIIFKMGSSLYIISSLGKLYQLSSSSKYVINSKIRRPYHDKSENNDISGSPLHQMKSKKLLKWNFIQCKSLFGLNINNISINNISYEDEKYLILYSKNKSGIPIVHFLHYTNEKWTKYILDEFSSQQLYIPLCIGENWSERIEHYFSSIEGGTILRYYHSDLPDEYLKDSHQKYIDFVIKGKIKKAFIPDDEEYLYLLGYDGTLTKIRLYYFDFSVIIKQDVINDKKTRVIDMFSSRNKYFLILSKDD